jgi:branched-chain amino acid transport system substrate-binding protein
VRAASRSAKRCAALGVALLALCLPPKSWAADAFDVDVILPLTGSGTFIGHGELQALQALEASVNKSGGIAGRPLHFVVQDDQSNPQTSVQLAGAIIAKKAAVILGPASVGTCGAVAPLVKDGPVMYCFSPGLHPPPGSYAYSSSISTRDEIVAAVRYLRERGWTKIAVITSTDATGQDAEEALNDAFALPENRNVLVADREHFNPSDVSVSAQMSRVKGSGAQALIAWTTGTPAGTIFRGIVESGLDVPVLTANGNANHAEMKQYAQVLPRELYFSSEPCIAFDKVTDRASRAAIGAFYDGMQSVGAQGDFIASTAWDPALVVVTALRKVGPNATAVQLRDAIDHLKGFVGADGPYDFQASPQRGLSAESAYIVRWDADKGTWIGVSKAGGIPIR